MRVGPCSRAPAQHPPVCTRGQRGKQKGKLQTNLSKRSERSDAHFPTLRLFEERTGECRGQNLLFRDNFSRPLDPACGELGLSKFTLVNAFCFCPFAIKRSGGGNVTEGSMRNPEPRNRVLPPCPPPTRSPGLRGGNLISDPPSPPLLPPCHLSHPSPHLFPGPLDMRAIGGGEGVGIASPRGPAVPGV